MNLDFSQPAPQAKTLDEAQQIIDALWAVIAGYQANQKTLATRLADLEEKLNTLPATHQNPLPL